MSESVGARGEDKNQALHETDDDLAETMQLYVDVDIDIDHEDDDNLNVLFVVSRASVFDKQPPVPTKPLDDLEWANSAIMDCWNVTLASYTPNGQLKMDDSKVAAAESKPRKYSDRIKIYSL